MSAQICAIDIHAHTSKHPMKGLHVTDASLPALKALAKAAGVTKVYLMATYFPLKKTGVHNWDMLERINDDQFFGVFGSLDMTSDFDYGFQQLKDLLRQRLISGIKLYPGYQKFHLCSREALRICELAECFSVPVMAHMGDLHHCCEIVEGKPTKCGRITCPLDQQQLLAHPHMLDYALTLFPCLRFIASHLALPYTDELVDMMKRHKNLYTDIGGLVKSDDEYDNYWDIDDNVKRIKSIINDVPEGLHRVMFATDFPIQSYADTMKMIDGLGLTNEERRCLLEGNAADCGL